MKLDRWTPLRNGRSWSWTQVGLIPKLMFPTTESRLLKKLFRAPPLPLEPFSLSPDLLVSALSLLFPRTQVATGWGAGDWSPSGRITAMVLFHALHRGERARARAGQRGHWPCAPSLDAADDLDFWDLQTSRGVWPCALFLDAAGDLDFWKSFWFFKGDLPSS